MGQLDGRRVLLGVTGGIAAYKAALLARLLVHAGATVDPVLTRGAERFVGAATFEGLTGRPARTEVWEDVADETHVGLGRAADVAVVYPASAHTIAKLAGGLADDLLTTTLLAARCPVVVCPAMHTEMWQHPATVDNIATLTRRRVAVVGPATGTLMGGDSGAGRVVEPQAALAAAVAALESAAGPGPAAHVDPATPSPADLAASSRADLAAPSRADLAAPSRADLAAPSRADLAASSRADLAGRTVVVTAGGTREPIDPVRFLGNRSTGKMGFAVAAAAAARGATVHLVAGPSSLSTPPGVTRHDVTTAIEMGAAVTACRDEADVIVKAAAVADFRPAQVADRKLKKDAGLPTIELVRNPDLLAELGVWRDGRERPVLVGFAAETNDVDRNGAAKLARKRVDLLVVNDVSRSDAGFGVDTNQVTILAADGSRDEVMLATKAEVADRILDAATARLVW